jgi:ACT domain-containing protein
VKYSKDLVERICAEFAAGEHSVADVCKKVGLAESTFYKWKEEKSEFSESLKKADELRLSAFKNLARSGLAKLLDVYEYDEMSRSYSVDKKGTRRVKFEKATRRKVMPSATAVIFALKNLDSENFQDKQAHELTGKNGAPIMGNITVTVLPAGPPLASSEKEVDDVL